MKAPVTVCLALILAAAWVPAGAVRLSWFGPPPFAGLEGPDSSSLSPLDTSYRFGLEVEEPPSDSLLANPYALPGHPRSPGDSIRFYGALAPVGPWPALLGGASGPLLTGPGARGLNRFGVKWRHWVNRGQSFAVSAEAGQGDGPLPLAQPTEDTRAGFSWTTQWSGNYRPAITGGVYLGNETLSDQVFSHLGRQYYGIAIGGQLRLFREHTPYVTLRTQRGVSDQPGGLPVLSPGSGNLSQLAAGWKWQVRRDLTVQAEARYGLDGNLNPAWYVPERSRFFFGTRFDFK